MGAVVPPQTNIFNAFNEELRTLATPDEVYQSGLFVAGGDSMMHLHMGRPMGGYPLG